MGRALEQWGAKGGKHGPKVYLAYKYLDVSQGQTIRQWEGSNGTKLMELAAELSKKNIGQALHDGDIVKYTDPSKFDLNYMPKPSKWKYPKSLSGMDVQWCKICLGSRLRVIGFLEDNIYQIVFLDNAHKFYP